VSRLVNSEDRDRVSMVAMVGGPSLAVLAVVAGLPPLVWLPSAACGGLAAWYRWDERYDRTLAEDVEAAFVPSWRVRAKERPLPAGVLLVLTPSPPLAEPQLRALLAGPVAAHGYKTVSICRAARRRGSGTVTLVELMPL
jgi:hypothetical protein